MGVPKFFRYIAERYPCLSELARERCIPQFDNLYLDMNGIIHNCSHDDSNSNFDITEEDMFKDIFNYIDKLFFLIKPQKLFFMAIDGVAPRAKMNQQRCRRFRSAKDALLREKLALTRGEITEKDSFDSNCITPGTEFMERLHEALRCFIKSKISGDPLWKKCRVIFSGHNSPGEGEHKIMDYIRYLKSQSDFNPNTRHCLYGLDADLIILGLCTHELHFVILREEVKFGKKSKKTSLEQTRFFLLHLGLLREYLELEFDEIKQEDQNLNIANLIDDWILMGFLVGNDFIPHLPCLHISHNALPMLYKTYKTVYKSLGGNINENGKLNLLRLEKYFAALAEVEFNIFQENRADLKYFAVKPSKNGIDEAFDFDVNEINNENTDDDLAALIESSRQFLEDDDDYSPDNEQHINDEFENYKRNYYMDKLKKDYSNSEHTKEQAIGYITALQWILDYYYRGVQSWDWYYPHHYAPFVSDLKDFQNHKITFNMGKPFLPFQQLLAVLPADSKTLLPTAYRDLMTNPSSELIDYFPGDFETDLNGKQHEWEAVVLIPFIDEKKLLQAMKPCDQNLNPAEHKRNQHGPMLQYDYYLESQEQASGIYYLKPFQHVYCTENPLWYKDILVSPHKTVCAELPNANRTEFFPGFPTMKHLNYKFEIVPARVKVFDYPSRNENMIIKPESREHMDDIVTVAEKYLNENVYIGWPHLILAKVVAVSNKEKYIDADGTKSIDPKEFQFKMKTAQEHIYTRMGIEFPDYSVLVHARIYLGTTYNCGSHGKITSKEIWSSTARCYPAHGVVSHISVRDSSLAPHKKIELLFPENSKIFFVGNPYYGSEGVVMDPMLVYECGRLKVNITVLPEPEFSEAKCVQKHFENDYVNLSHAATQTGISFKCLNRLIGSVPVVKGPKRFKYELPENVSKLNIGLQFKFMKQQEELVGYARRIDNQWLLSLQAITLVKSYVERFFAVIDYLSNGQDRPEFIFEEDIFPSAVGEAKLDEIISWLKEKDHMKAERVACGSKIMEKESVEKVLEAIEHLKTLPVKTVKLQVKPHLLLKPDVSLPVLYKPKNPIKLFDRVVIVRTTYMVPIGSKGTVVGIYPVSDPNPVRLECVKVVDNFYEVLFDKHITNGNDIHGIARERVYKVAESAVLLIYTQDKKNENLYSSKIIDPSENNANVPINSWRRPRTTNISSNEICVPHLEKMSDTQAVQKGGDEFWMPATSRKLNTVNPIQTRMQSQIPKEKNLSHKNTKLEITNSTMEPQQCTDGTQLLKSLLGLSTNETEAPAAKPQLPQPPTSWRADAQKMPVIPYNTSRMAPPQGSKCVPTIAPVALLGANIFPLPTNHQYPEHELQEGKPGDQNPPHFQQVTQQQANLNMPQDKTFSLNSLKQKGAFIPLQVSRGNFSKNSKTSTESTTNIQKVPGLPKDTITPNLSELSLQHDDVTNTKDQTTTDIKPTYGRKKPPRIPKIAAKFDNV